MFEGYLLSMYVEEKVKSGHTAIRAQKNKTKTINPPYWVNFPGGADSVESTKNSQEN